MSKRADMRFKFDYLNDASAYPNLGNPIPDTREAHKERHTDQKSRIPRLKIPHCQLPHLCRNKRQRSEVFETDKRGSFGSRNVIKSRLSPVKKSPGPNGGTICQTRSRSTRPWWWSSSSKRNGLILSFNQSTSLVWQKSSHNLAWITMLSIQHQWCLKSALKTGGDRMTKLMWEVSG